jgi:hypothetical protein
VWLVPPERPVRQAMRRFADIFGARPFTSYPTLSAAIDAFELRSAEPRSPEPDR